MTARELITALLALEADDLDLDAIEAKAQEATPGPWSYRQTVDLYAAVDGKGRNVAYEATRKDAAHIASADPPTVLALVAAAREREALRAEVERLRGGLNEMVTPLAAGGERDQRIDVAWEILRRLIGPTEGAPDD